MLDGKVYRNSSAIPLTEIGRVIMHFITKQTRKSIVEWCQTGLASSTTPTVSVSLLPGNSRAPIATEVTRSYV